MDGGDSSLLPSNVISQLRRVPLGTLACDLWHLAWSVRVLPPLGLRQVVHKWLPRRAAGVPAWLADPLLRRFDATARWNDMNARRAATDRARGLAVSDILDSWWTSTFESYDPGGHATTGRAEVPFLRCAAPLTGRDAPFVSLVREQGNLASSDARQTAGARSRTAESAFGGGGPGHSRTLDLGPGS